jgi:hypothetical protein
MSFSLTRALPPIVVTALLCMAPVASLAAQGPPADAVFSQEASTGGHAHRAEHALIRLPLAAAPGARWR